MERLRAVDPGRMRANLELTGGLIASERASCRPLATSSDANTRMTSRTPLLAQRLAHPADRNAFMPATRG